VGFNVAGGVTGSLQEVETATLAARVTSRYTDPATFGHYHIAVDNGTAVMAAGLAANSPIFSWRWGNANIAAVYGVRVGMVNGGTAFAAGRVALDLFVARSFTASDTGGTTPTITGNNLKKRTSFGTTLLTDARVSATATLSAGTRTLDANPIGKALATVPITTVSYQIIQPNTPLFVGRDNSDQAPLIFAQNEGLVIQASVPATGTWFFQVSIDWLEIAAY
jgi:hypothetical protein